MTRTELLPSRAFAAFVASVALAGCAGGSSSIEGTVELLGGDLPSGTSVTLSGEKSAKATLTATGTFDFENLGAGKYTVSVTVPSTVEGTQTRDVTLTASASSQDLVIPFNATGSISGVVTATENPVQGVPVSIVDTTLTTMTAQDGSFSFKGVPVGSYWISVSVPTYLTRTTEAFLVQYNQTTVLPAIGNEMDLTNGQGAISGNVSLTGQGPAVGAMVTAAAVGETTATATTDNNGNFSFPQLDQDYWNVTVTVANTVEGMQTVMNVVVNEDDVTVMPPFMFTPSP